GLVVVRFVHRDGTERIEDLALLQAVDVVSERAVHSLALRAVVTESFRLSDQPIVEREIRSHDPFYTSRYTNARATETFESTSRFHETHDDTPTRARRRAGAIRAGIVR